MLELASARLQPAPQIARRHAVGHADRFGERPRDRARKGDACRNGHTERRKRRGDQPPAPVLDQPVDLRRGELRPLIARLRELLEDRAQQFLVACRGHVEHHKIRLGRTLLDQLVHVFTVLQGESADPVEHRDLVLAQIAQLAIGSHQLVHCVDLGLEPVGVVAAAEDEVPEVQRGVAEMGGCLGHGLASLRENRGHLRPLVREPRQHDQRQRDDAEHGRDHNGESSAELAAYFHIDLPFPSLCYSAILDLRARAVTPPKVVLCQAATRSSHSLRQPDRDRRHPDQEDREQDHDHCIG